MLDRTKPVDVIIFLGKPSSGKDRGYKQGAWRVITLKKSSGHEGGQLFFLDGVLTAIKLRPQEKIRADARPSIYGVKFEPRFGGASEARSPR